MFNTQFPMRVRSTTHSAGLKELIIASFAADADAVRRYLPKFQEADWKSVMWWLDASGMALYFFDQARKLGVDQAVPPSVISEFVRRFENNKLRMESLREEAYALAGLLESAGIHYAILKGFTLVPESSPIHALRAQTDLDFLVNEQDAGNSIRLIRLLGYKHFATSGHVIEFRAGAPGKPDMANLYKASTLRSLELHLLPERSCDESLLTRRVSRSFDDRTFYALSPADTLVHQSIHLLKHLCGEHTRLSWILELWRHATARRSDIRFWREVEERAVEAMNGDLAMSVAFWCAQEFFSDARESVPERWGRQELPMRVRLWLERYARQLLTSDLIGNKLYALLRAEIPCGPHEVRKTRNILLPTVLPFRVLEAQRNETLSRRLDRYSIELKFFLRRLVFHLRESLRLAVESARWNRAVAKAEQ